MGETLATWNIPVVDVSIMKVLCGPWQRFWGKPFQALPSHTYTQHAEILIRRRQVAKLVLSLVAGVDYHLILVFFFLTSSVKRVQVTSILDCHETTCLTKLLHLIWYQLGILPQVLHGQRWFDWIFSSNEIFSVAKGRTHTSPKNPNYLLLYLSIIT